MDRKTQSSDLHRVAEQAVRNEERLLAWQKKWKTATGYDPIPEPPPARTVRHQARVRRRHHLQAVATNMNIVKFPRRKKQYMHNELPTGPEAA